MIEITKQANAHEEYKNIKFRELEGDPSLSKASTVVVGSKEKIPNKHCIPKETYTQAKGKLMLSECLKEFFQNDKYQREVIELSSCLPKASPVPFKYQIETIEKNAKEKFPLVETGIVEVEK